MYDTLYEWSMTATGEISDAVIDKAASALAVVCTTIAPAEADAQHERSKLFHAPGSGGVGTVWETTGCYTLSDGLCCGWICAGNGRRRWRHKENWVAVQPKGLEGPKGGEGELEGGVEEAGGRGGDGALLKGLPLTPWEEIYQNLLMGVAALPATGGTDKLPSDRDGLLHQLWTFVASAAVEPEKKVKAQTGGSQGMKPRPLFSLLQPRCYLPPQLPAHRGRRTLLLDLDETLIHSYFSLEEGAHAHFYIEIFGQMTDVSVLKRAGVDEFLRRVAERFEVVVFTASIPSYADAIIDWLDPEGSLIHHRLYRDSCTWWRGGYVKDLAKVGRDLCDTIIVDNSPHSFSFQTKNGVCVTSFIDDEEDRELLLLAPPLLRLAEGEGDVRDELWTCYVGEAVEEAVEGA